MKIENGKHRFETSTGHGSTQDGLELSGANAPELKGCGYPASIETHLTCRKIANLHGKHPPIEGTYPLHLAPHSEVQELRAQWLS